MTKLWTLRAVADAGHRPSCCQNSRRISSDGVLDADEATILTVKSTMTKFSGKVKGAVLAGKESGVVSGSQTPVGLPGSATWSLFARGYDQTDR